MPYHNTVLLNTGSSMARPAGGFTASQPISSAINCTDNRTGKSYMA